MSLEDKALLREADYQGIVELNCPGILFLSFGCSFFREQDEGDFCPGSLHNYLQRFTSLLIIFNFDLFRTGRG